MPSNRFGNSGRYYHNSSDGRKSSNSVHAKSETKPVSPVKKVEPVPKAPLPVSKDEKKAKFKPVPPPQSDHQGKIYLVCYRKNYTSVFLLL